jgi:DNA-binding transcriptional regulator LsrR (DeoR family)
VRTRDEVARAVARDQLAGLASLQREIACDLRDAARYAHEKGLSWREIGETLGMVRETVFRQVQAGSPVSVVRPVQSPGTRNGC